MRPKEGDRFIVRTPFAATVMTHWEAAYTGGAKRVLPEGLVFLVDYDPPETATAVGGAVEAPERWLTLLVDEADRNAPKFAGFSVSVALDALAAFCAKL